MPKRRRPKSTKTDFSDCPEVVTPNKRRRRRIEVENTPSSSVDESVVTGVLQGEIKSLYFFELQKRKNSIVILNKEATDFFLQDFNVRINSLWEKRYVSLSRKCISFKCTSDPSLTNLQWVYSCVCDQGHADVVKASGSSVNLKHEEWLQLNPRCLHAEVLSLAMIHFDELFSFTPSLEQEEVFQDHELLEVTAEDPTFIVLQEGIMCVKPSSHSWGILSSSAQGMKCVTCKNSSCVHIKFVLQSVDTESCPDFVLDFNDLCIESQSGATTLERSPKCLSYKPIRFNRPGAVKGLIPVGDDVLSAADETDSCPFCGAEPLSCCPAKGVTLFTQYQRETVYVYNASAETCDHLIPFDGMEIGMLNMGTYLVGHDVLRDYLLNFLCGRMPLFTFYSCWKQRQIDAGNSEDGMLSYSKFRFAWYSFLSLIAEDFDESFICPVCKDAPSVVIFDATGLAFRRSYVPKKQKEPEPLEQQSRKKSGSSFKERVMIRHKKTREMLQYYCNPLNSLESLNMASLDKHAPAVKKMVEWCILHYGDSAKKLAPKEVRPFLLSLTKPSPVCALLPPSEEMRQLLDEMKVSDIKQNPSSLQSLQSLSPILFDLVKNIQFKDSSLPLEFHDLLAELWTKSFAPFSHNDIAATTTEPITESDSFIESVSHWPHLPRVRGRGTYPMDNNHDKQSCRKMGTGHKSLLPGTVTLHCQHDVCYGFEVMLQVESPNTIFSILRTRFTTAPGVVIYDYACGLHNYCLNREPKFFQETKFLIDRYHQPNHKGCSLGYKMALYHRFKDINSQIAEQKNSKLARIKSQLSYMKPVNFIQHAKLFVWYYNSKRITALSC